MSKSKTPFALSPMGYGLMVVVIYAAHYFALVRRVLERQALRGLSSAGISMPGPLSLTSIYSTSVELAEAQALASSPALVETDVDHHFEVFGLNRSIDPLLEEGLGLLGVPIRLAKGSWVSVSDGGFPLGAPQASIGLDRLRALSVRSQVRTMLFVNGTTLPTAFPLRDYCDQRVDVRACEPDPGGLGAFSITCPAFESLHALGMGAAMCSFQIHKGRYRFKSSPFIAATVENRYMWMLYCAGMRMEKIGERFKLSRSAVSRRLSGMPGKQELDLPDDWEEAYRMLLDAESPLNQARKEGRGSEGTGEEDQGRE
ncbi:hypothetical protein [Variovorax sp. Varisp62]|uniref:hypothetical protein n=1 Tax=Variovorax sp. Varisp62 TaxID=3243049 RepID=UPI0039B4748D